MAASLVNGGGSFCSAPQRTRPDLQTAGFTLFQKRMKKLILTALIGLTVSSSGGVLDDLKEMAAGEGFAYKGIDHISAGSYFYRFVNYTNGPIEVWIPVNIKDDWDEKILAWRVGVASASMTVMDMPVRSEKPKEQ
jgi:hypothetical protein